jgi:type IV pilus biogenesis protein CpaD/CtpE
MRISPVLPLLFAVSAMLTACEHNTDLIARLNDEPMGHVNQSNIAAMVANPADLIRGHGGGPVDAADSAAPIERLESDHPKALLTPGHSGGGSGGGGSSGGSSGG